jgi:heterotetrameric sarcosine oxidase delta subunit
MLRSWGGIMDMSPDGSPIIDKTHIEGLYLNCGWCYGGFKAVPGSGNVFAHLIATDRPHEAAARYRLDRFATGRADGRRRHRQPAQPALGDDHADHLPPLRGSRHPRIHLSRVTRPTCTARPRRGPEAWDDYLHNRDNPAGETRELWYHGSGCGAWLLVTRNTITHEIHGVALAREARARCGLRDAG